MITKPPSDIFQENLAEEPDCLTSLDAAIKLFFQNKPFSLQECIDHCHWQETCIAPERAIENWKNLLVVQLLGYLKGCSAKEMDEKVCHFDKQPWDQDSQYLRVLVALNHWFSKMPVPDLGILLLENGAAPISLQEYAPQLAIPYSPYHIEFALFLSLLAFLTKRKDLADWVARLAKWQLNTLDYNYTPFHSLFVREEEGSKPSLLRLYTLFFYTAACLTKEKEFESVSQILRRQLAKEPFVSPNLWDLIEKVLPPPSMDVLPALSLSEHIYDPSTSLVGLRSEKQSVVCTLHGANTGLGFLKWGGVELVNFGPQYVPLDQSKGFGIEGNYLSDKGLRKSFIELKRKGFLIKGCVRLVDEPSTVQGGGFRGIWMDIAQELKGNSFSLDASFLGLDGWDGTAFCFYVKAEKCRIGSIKTIHYGTFDSYEGISHPLFFDGKDASLLFSIPAFDGSLRIVPLEGKERYWGANFLVGYLLHPKQRHYQWEIIPN